MTRLTLMILKDQLWRWLICTLSCVVLLGVSFLSEQKFNIERVLLISLSASPHCSLIWGVTASRLGANRLSLASSSVGLSPLKWWGPTLIAWFASVSLSIGYEGNIRRAHTRPPQAKIWSCTWLQADSVSPGQARSGVCFLSPTGELTAWRARPSEAPTELSLAQLTAPPPRDVEQKESWALLRVSARCGLAALLLMSLLTIPDRYLGALSVLSYALAWLWERALLSS